MRQEENKPEVAGSPESGVEKRKMKFRAYRNSLIDLLPLPVNTFPLPDIPVFALQPVVQHELSGKIVLSYSQPDVSYTLYDQTKTQAVDIQNTTDEHDRVISVDTLSLTNEDYTFSVLATKSNKPGFLVSTQLLQTVLIKIGIKKDLVVQVTTTPVPYGSKAVVVVKDAQRGTRYQLFDNDHALSAETDSGAGGDLEISTTGPLKKDVKISVKSTNIKTGQNGMLDEQPDILVSPNTALIPKLVGTAADYNGTADITLADTQQTAVYQVRFEDIDDDAVDKKQMKNTSLGAAVPGNDGTIVLPVAMLKEDLTVNILAIKKSSGIQQQLTKKLLIPVRPDINKKLSVVENYLKPGDMAVKVSNTQPGVMYQLKTDEDNKNIGKPGYHHKKRGIGEAQIELDFVVDPFTDDSVYLPTGHLLQTTTFHVLAIKATTKLDAVLINKIMVEVPAIT